jgi:hypothetical protein
MIYSKRRKNLGGGRKRSNRSSRQRYSKKGRNMRGGSSDMEANITPEYYGFTGYQYDYNPCDDLKGKWDDEAQQKIYIDCLKVTPKWDNLDLNAKKNEIQRQWHALPETSRECLIKASPEERDFIHKFVNLNSKDRVDTWENLSPEQKNFLIGILEDAKTKTELRKIELIKKWETTPTTYPNYDREKRNIGFSIDAAKRDYDNAKKEYDIDIEFYNASVEHFKKRNSNVGKAVDYLMFRGTTYLNYSTNDVNYKKEAAERSKTIMDAAKKKWEELQAKFDEFDVTYKLPDKSAVDDTIRSIIDSEKYIENAIAEVKFLFNKDSAKIYLDYQSSWLEKSTTEKMKIIYDNNMSNR